MINDIDIKKESESLESKDNECRVVAMQNLHNIHKEEEILWRQILIQKA